jgi:outer membrane receptor protein involved in Fe transport
MRDLFLSLTIPLLFVFIFSSYAQQGGDGSITGKVVLKDSKKPIEYATVSLYRMKDSSLVTGTITDEQGQFVLSNLNFGKYFIEISFIGFNTRRINDVMVKPDNIRVILEPVYLEFTTEQIKEVEIVASRPVLEFAIDKKIVHVSQDISSAGGTAASVLENTPSIESDIEGNVSLRGSSNFKVLVDGKPSLQDGNDLLKQIPADAIQQIEIITNPSAKYDPDGLGGIINIVMKKQRQGGINGLVTAAVGTGGKYNATTQFNHQVKKINYTGGLTYSKHQFETRREFRRIIYSKDTSYRNTNATGFIFNNSLMLNAGIDYALRPNSTFSLVLKGGQTSRGRDFESYYHEYSNSLPSLYSFRESNAERDANPLEGGLSYSFYTVDQKHKIDALVNVASFSKNDDQDYIEYFSDETYKNYLQLPYEHRIIEDGTDFNTRAKTDYVYKISDKRKFEAGWQSDFDYDKGSYRFEIYDTLSTNWINPGNENKINFKHNVHALYAIFADEFWGLGWQAGLRGELTDRLLDQITLNQKFHIYRFDYFPSLHISKKLPAKQQVQISYSRRINRPGDRELDPFPSFFDRQNYRIGNPYLEPEYMNSFQGGYQKYVKAGFFSTELYYRKTNGLMQRVAQLDTGDIIKYSYVNISSDQSIGLESVINMAFAKWWNFNLSGTIYNYKMIGNVYDEEVNRTNNTWNMRLNNTFRLGENTRLQSMTFYNGPSVTAQGERKGFYSISAGLRQDFLKKRASLTFNVQDIFSTFKMDIVQNSPQLYNRMVFNHKSPVFMLNFSYRINNFKSERNREGKGGDNGIERSINQMGDI